MAGHVMSMAVPEQGDIASSALQQLAVAKRKNVVGACVQLPDQDNHLALGIQLLNCSRQIPMLPQIWDGVAFFDCCPAQAEWPLIEPLLLAHETALRASRAHGLETLPPASLGAVSVPPSINDPI
eukprot:CAMPEP_0115189168 /NCGR_PEP_ID=MMETSP0270-20121206/11381_1 /TAXON_ID=71861 /ORGANISM="Scrippsiella trochoidea, Strain CCMP3099" /LENGTH=124 /DNA_ID=CAMNT_0002602361 /DNA_START=219 /DNA_END=592 /DNA_ORIENTATION=-